MNKDEYNDSFNVQVQALQTRIAQLARRAAKRGNATKNELEEIAKLKEDIKKHKRQ